MKYRQLTKEQFESLHEEFSKFLATQSIDVKEWTTIKTENPSLAEEEMNLFSDVVWEDVLNKTEYLEHFSSKTINLFKCFDNEIKRIVIKVEEDIDLLTENGYNWLLEHYNNQEVSFFQGKKEYTTERNLEIFDLIEKGSTISNGDLFTFFEKIIS
ncbi:hypothetical protein EV195_10989 [Tenacibaculum skagerrakense]|uniref:Histidyl-tRNA synthetase n=1 Tax=Tenacibaculum skagerrakense TaxID=186571 RepID=A0A4R2NNL8_9FLAO|nr:DUF6495 family protein [Tenacibaculum skagerrakense]TCP23363.1 hypothetical protein EV195_10989 [Tenacibaculum skagerrakense]